MRCKYKFRILSSYEINNKKFAEKIVLSERKIQNEILRPVKAYISLQAILKVHA